MNSSPFPQLLKQFPTCTVHDMDFKSVLLNIWSPAVFADGACPAIKCSLCPPGEGFFYTHMLREWHFFRHITQQHYNWWLNLGWGLVKCPTSYSEWVSTVDMESWENVCLLKAGFDSDSDLSFEPPTTPLWMPSQDEGYFGGKRSNAPSEEF